MTEWRSGMKNAPRDDLRERMRESVARAIRKDKFVRIGRGNVHFLHTAHLTTALSASQPHRFPCNSRRATAVSTGLLTAGNATMASAICNRSSGV